MGNCTGLLCLVKIRGKSKDTESSSDGIYQLQKNSTILRGIAAIVAVLLIYAAIASGRRRKAGQNLRCSIRTVGENSAETEALEGKETFRLWWNRFRQVLG